MKQIKKYIALLPVFAIVMSGCKKGLELTNAVSVSSSEAFSTAAKCLVSLNGVYDGAQSGAYTDGTVRGYPFGSANIEQGDCRGEDVLNVATFYQVTYQASYNSTAANCVALWNTLYALINKANTCIDGFRAAGSGGILSSTDALQYEAECRFLRAMAHHELMIQYARPYRDGNGTLVGIPYRGFAVNVPSTVDSVRKLPRDVADTVYKRILRDLDFCETNLATQLTGTTARTVRATKAAAIALKMRVKLHMGDWAGVITEGNKLIPTVITPLTPSTIVCPIGAWALTATPDGPFTNNSSTESIFSIKNDAIDNTGVNGSLPSMYGTVNVGGRGLVAISPVIWNNAGWRCDDLRRTLLYVSGGNSNSATQFNIFTTKYKDYVNRADFAPQIRYAEVFLTLAEAEARNAGAVTQRAVDLLNCVRNRSSLNPALTQYTLASFATVVDLVKAILFERRIEFLAEGKRWGDISRLAVDASYTTNGIPAKAVNGANGSAIYNCGGGYTPGQGAIAYSDFRFLFPIPSDEIIQNPIVAQNPGY